MLTWKRRRTTINAMLVLCMGHGMLAGCKSPPHEAPGAEGSATPGAPGSGSSAPVGLEKLSAAEVVGVYCATCHKETQAAPTTGKAAPTLAQLKQMSPEAIVVALESGAMRPLAAPLTAAQKPTIAEFLTGKKYVVAARPGNYCPPEWRQDAGRLEGAHWTGWGANLSNTRFQPASDAKLSAADVPRLKLKWAFPLPGSDQGNPLVVSGSRVYFGSDGRVYSIDRDTGCIYWTRTLDDDSEVRTAIVLRDLPGADGRARSVAIFGDRTMGGHLYAVDALTGARIWKVQIPTPYSNMSFALPMFDGTLYIGLTTGTESHMQAMDPKWQCCRGRGAVYAVDSATGEIKWRSYTVPDPQPTTRSENGTQRWGPSGASVWLVPVIDPKLGRLYAPTGQNASSPATKTADAILALDLKTGEISWSRQTFTEPDIWNGACTRDGGAKDNCNFVVAGGFDTSTPLLVTRSDGRRLLVVADKTGFVRALDPDHDGAELWKTKLTAPSPAGGPAHFAMASDGDKVYVPVSARLRLTEIGREFGFQKNLIVDHDAGEMVALHLADGSIAWRMPPPKDTCKDKGEQCFRGLSAPPTAIDGVVFAGALDGHLRAYASANGQLLWDFDTTRKFDTPDGPATGGSIDGAGGPIVAGGLVLVSSGYSFMGEMPGNALLAFSVDGK
jgi:polyvinyl alcohol dehydrogenase (cytochrome)